MALGFLVNIGTSHDITSPFERCRGILKGTIFYSTSDGAIRFSAFVITTLASFFTDPLTFFSLSISLKPIDGIETVHGWGNRGVKVRAGGGGTQRWNSGGSRGRIRWTIGGTRSGIASRVRWHSGWTRVDEDRRCK